MKNAKKSTAITMNKTQVQMNQIPQQKSRYTESNRKENVGKS